MKKASIALYTLVLCTSSNSVSTISMSALHKHSMHYCFCAGKGLYSPLLCVLCTSPNSMHIHPGDTSYTLWTLTMGIRVLLNPFSTERLTRQRLLNALQQTEDYIMSQQVLYNDSLNTCKQDTDLFPMSRMPHVICLDVKTLLQVVKKALSHKSATLWNRSPRVILASTCWIGPTLTEYAGIRQKHIARRTWGGHDMATTVLYRKLSRVTENDKK